MESDAEATLKADKIPVVIEREKFSNFTERKRVTGKVPKVMTVVEFQEALRKMANIPAKADVFLYSIKNYLISQLNIGYSMEKIYELNASDNGFLHVIYSDREIASKGRLEETLSRLLPNLSIESRIQILETIHHSSGLELIAKYLNHTSNSVEDYLQEYNSCEYSSFGYIRRCLLIAINRFAKDHPLGWSIIWALLLKSRIALNKNQENNTALFLSDLFWDEIQALLDIDLDKVQEFVRCLCDFGIVTINEQQKSVSIILVHMNAIIEDLDVMRLVSLLIQRFTDRKVNCQNLVSLTKLCVSSPADKECTKTLQTLAFRAAETLCGLQCWNDSLEFYCKTFDFIQLIGESSDFTEIYLIEKIEELSLLLGKYSQAQKFCAMRSTSSPESIMKLALNMTKIQLLIYRWDPYCKREESATFLETVFAKIDKPVETPEGVILHSLKAEFLLLKQDLDNALVEAQLAQQLSEFHSAHVSKSDALEIQLTLGIVHSVHKNYVEAKFILERVIRDSEELYGVDHPNLIYALLALCGTLYHLAKYDTLEPLLEKAFHLSKIYFPSGHLVTSQLGSLYASVKIDMGKFSEVLTLEYLVYKADALILTGKFDEAISLLEPCISSSFDGGIAYLGILYALCGKFVEVQPYLANLRKCNETPSFLTLQGMSVILNAMGEYVEALDYATKALTLKESWQSYPHHPIFITTLCVIGEIQGHLQNYSEALSALDRALRIGELTFGLNFAENARVLLYIGFVHFKSENYQDALSFLNRARQLIRADAYYLPEVLLYMGCVLIKLERTDEALPILRNAATLFHEQGRFSPNLEHNKLLSSTLLSCGESVRYPETCTEHTG